MIKTKEPKTDEFTRFEELTKKLVAVPKKDVQKEEEKFRRVRTVSEKKK